MTIFMLPAYFSTFSPSKRTTNIVDNEKYSLYAHCSFILNTSVADGLLTLTQEANIVLITLIF